MTTRDHLVDQDKAEEAVKGDPLPARLLMLATALYAGMFCCLAMPLVESGDEVQALRNEVHDLKTELHGLKQSTVEQGHQMDDIRIFQQRFLSQQRSAEK